MLQIIEILVLIVTISFYIHNYDKLSYKKQYEQGKKCMEQNNIQNFRKDFNNHD